MMETTIAKMIAFKWLFFFVGFLGIVAKMLEKCAPNDWAGIKKYFAENLRAVILSSLLYTGGYVLWANALPVVKGWAWAQSFLFVFEYKMAAGSFFLAYWINNIVRAAERKLKEKGVVADDVIDAKKDTIGPGPIPPPPPLQD